MTSPEITDIVNDAKAVGETYSETIQRLAALPTHEYERCRKAEAKRLDMRTSVLDKEVKSARPRDDAGNDLGLTEPVPSPEEVDGADLLDRIVGGWSWPSALWRWPCCGRKRKVNAGRGDARRRKRP